MKKERFKNILLTSLVILSLLLTGKIWLNEKLWPDGYNFFAVLNSKFTELFSGSEAEDTRNLLFPAHMIAYTVKDSDHAGCLLTDANESYAQVRDFCDASIANALAQPAKYITAADEDTWRNALFTNGIFLDYGTGIPTDVFCAFSGVSAQADIVSQVANVRYVIISAEGNLVSNISVFLRDMDGNSFKIATLQPKAELTDALNPLKEFVTPNNRFSFFIGADTATSAMGEVLFAPFLLLTENEPQLPTVQAENLLAADSAALLSDEHANQLLHSVAMNPKTAKKYTDADGNVIFLQNQSTLKISKNGYIEYSAAAGQNGFKLSDKPTADTSAQAHSAVNLIYDLYGIFSDRTPSLFFNGFTATENGFILNLDYNLGGSKVLTDLNGGHAAELELENGYVKSFSLCLRSYSITDKQITLPSSYTAVDLIFAQMDAQKDNTTIENMFIGYSDTGTANEIRPTWFIKIENETQLRTSQF